MCQLLKIPGSTRCIISSYPLMNEFLIFSDLKKIVAVLSVINLVGEKEEDLFLNAEQKSSVPRISVEGTLQFEVPQTFGVIVEGEEMAFCGEFLDAVGLLFAGFYISNIQFKDMSSSTLSFFFSVFWNR